MSGEESIVVFHEPEVQIPSLVNFTLHLTAAVALFIICTWKMQLLEVLYAKTLSTCSQMQVGVDDLDAQSTKKFQFSNYS